VGRIETPEPVQLLAGLLAADREWLERGEAAVRGLFGEWEAASRVRPFVWSSYYRRELGEEPLRRYLVFRRLIDPGELAELKVRSNELEATLSEGGERKVNIDPGYLDLSRLVLASTKDASWRIYIGGGIRAEVTLRFVAGGFKPWEWTYPDYRDPETLEFFDRSREEFRLRRNREKAG